MSNGIALIQQDIYSTRERFDKISGGALNFEREADFAVQVIGGSEYAMRIATGNRQSVINAVTNVAAIGISLNPAKRQAYLVPRDGKICLDISYMGLLDLAIQSGSIMWGQAEVVYMQDRFELHCFDKPPTHGRDPFAKDRGEITGAYVVVKTRDGDYLTTCMGIDEVFAIRDRSSAWKAWIEKNKRCPWLTDEGEMIKKTVIKRAYKLWPKTDRLDTAVHFLNTENDEGLAELATSNDKPVGSSTAKTAKTPESAAAQNAPDGLDAFETEHLENLKKAANNGTPALEAAFNALAKTKIRTAFWMKHKYSLKAAAEAAEAAEAAVVLEAEVAQAAVVLEAEVAQAAVVLEAEVAQ